MAISTRKLKLKPKNLFLGIITAPNDMPTAQNCISIKPDSTWSPAWRNHILMFVSRGCRCRK